MSGVVLDASAVLAYLQGEPGGEIVADHFAVAVIGAVNLSEVIAKLVDKGLDARAVDETLQSIGLDAVAFDASHATTAGLMRAATRKRGLSLGDRACLALAKARGAPALTADRAWAEVDTGVEVRMIR